MTVCNGFKIVCIQLDFIETVFHKNGMHIRDVLDEICIRSMIIEK